MVQWFKGLASALVCALACGPGSKSADHVPDTRWEVETDCGPIRVAHYLPPLANLEPPELDRLLAALADSVADFGARLRALTVARIGTPYALGTLGEESAGDPDPLFRVDEADCTVLVLTTTAMAHAQSVAEARRAMGPANYRPLAQTYPVTYANRWHFTSDRLHGSPAFRDQTRRWAGDAPLRRVRLTLNRTSSGAELLPINWQRSLELDYLPAALVAGVVSRWPALVGVAFVREAWRERGLLVAHEGILLDGHCLIHASSVAGQVVAVDFLDYLLGGDEPPRFDGVLIYSFEEVEGASTSGR